MIGIHKRSETVLLATIIFSENARPNKYTMDKTIKLRVKKEIDNSNELKVLKLKGKLITKGYTEIIHITDENDNFYLNSFSTSPDHKKEAEDFVLDYITSNDLTDTITLLGRVQ